jgi:homoserine kinase type II
MDVTLVKELAAAYQLALPLSFQALTSGMNNTSYLVQSGTARFVLKHYQSYDEPATLAYEHQLLRWLDTRPRSFAIPSLITDRRGETVVSIAEMRVALFRWLPGEPPQPTLAQVEAYGAALGELHATLADYPRDPRPGVFPYGDLDRVHPRVPDPARLDTRALAIPQSAEATETLSWWASEIAELQAFIQGPYRALPWQVIHGDVAFVNSLFLGDQLTALLDFEFATPDARALDVAAALRSLLRRRDPAMFRTLSVALLRGYRSSNTLTTEELIALPVLMRLSSAVSTLWWLGRDLLAGELSQALRRLDQARQHKRSVSRYAERLS